MFLKFTKYSDNHNVGEKKSISCGGVSLILPVSSAQPGAWPATPSAASQTVVATPVAAAGFLEHDALTSARDSKLG